MSNPIFEMEQFNNLKKALTLYMGDYLKKYNVNKVISIGSGTGKHEKTLKERVFEKFAININWVCIEPEPTVYQKGDMYIKPDYAYTSEYVEHDGMKNIPLLLNYTNPGTGKDECFKGCSSYDLESILLIEPSTIFIVMEKNGAAGSSYLSTWFNKRVIKNEFFNIFLPSFTNNKKYHELNDAIKKKNLIYEIVRAKVGETIEFIGYDRNFMVVQLNRVGVKEVEIPKIVEDVQTTTKTTFEKKNKTSNKSNKSKRKF